MTNEDATRPKHPARGSRATPAPDEMSPGKVAELDYKRWVAHGRLEDRQLED